MDNLNYWYYTLSAIPQTLGAIIALAATFVVFKLNFLSEKIKDSRKDLRRFILLLTSFKQTEIHDVEPLKDEGFLKLYEEGLANIKADEEKLGLDQGIYKRLEAELFRIIRQDWKSAFPPRQSRITGYLFMKRDLFKELLDIKKRSLNFLAFGLLLTTLTIVFSLFALPNYSCFNNPLLVVRIILVLSVLSVVFMAYSVWEIANS